MRRMWMAGLLSLAATTACQGSYYSTSSEELPPISDPAALARAEFESTILPVLQASCTACHAGAEPAFLRPTPDVYTTLKAWPQMVVPGKPSDSRLLSYGTSASHSGTNFTAEQAELVRAWIAMEPAAIVEDQSAETEAFQPIVGENELDLSVLGEGLDGARLTFKATRLTGALYLEKMTVHAGTSALRLAHPLMVSWCPDPMPDPVDSFGGLDLFVNGDSQATLGTGSASLAYDFDGCMLSIHFEAIAAAEPATTDPTAGGCKAVAAFTASLQAELNQRCSGCHAGSNVGASNAFNLANIANLDEEAQAQACGQTLSLFNGLLDTPDMSNLLRRVQPGQATGHPYTITNPTQFNTFRAAVVTWIDQEK